MAFIKLVNIGDELVFDLKGKSDEAQDISILLVERAGRQAVLKITVDKTIVVKQFRTHRIGDQVEKTLICGGRS